jgi:eukaryotic-like serine/threonine-protein kinase
LPFFGCRPRLSINLGSQAREHHSDQVRYQGPGFGLAKFLDANAVLLDAETLATQNVVLGTPAYMAPEQRTGKECDARTDIDALGLLLAEMATGRRHMSAYEPLPSDLPPQFAFVVERCLALDPDDRWQSCTDVRLALE